MFKVYPFVPGGIVEAPGEPREFGEEIGREVEALFAAGNRRRGGKMFDGLTFSVENLDDQRVVGRFVRYSLLVAQLAKPDLFDVLRVRPLGVSGLVTCADGIVFGRRHAAMTLDAGLWELGPSGGVDSSSRDGNGRIDVVGQICDEMREEIGIGREHVMSASPFALVENCDNHVIEVAVDIAVSLDGREIRRLFREVGSGEYTELAVVPPDQIRSFVEHRDGEWVEVSRILLREKGLL